MLHPRAGVQEVFFVSESHARHDAQFRDSGYGLIVQGLEPGSYELAAFAWTNVRAGFVPPRTVQVTVR